MSGSPLRSETAAQPALRRAPIHFAVAVRGGVQWISLIEPPRHGFKPPELPDCVTSAVDRLRSDAAAGSQRWILASCREAANILITGPDADSVAEQVTRYGACEKIVRCASRDDMLRVARVLALPGDYVVQGERGMLIFPPWF